MLLFIHGVYRIVAGGVTPFGGFLDSVGLPFGLAIAWVLTIAEVVGAPLLAFGVWTRVIALWFIAELIAGIILVHGREGWFVVGGGRNGVEYSVALILALASIALSEQRHRSRETLAA